MNSISGVMVSGRKGRVWAPWIASDWADRVAPTDICLKYDPSPN
jgi:hypothetical protein